MQAGRLREIWRSLEPRGQITIVGAVLATVVLAFVLFRVASHPSYTALATSLDPADAADVATALDGAGIAYQIVNGGTEVDVVKGQESRAKVALAAEGLPRGGHVGLEIFDKQALGATDFQQQVNYQRALEGEIARTIEEIEGVTSAQVQLVLPEDTLFADQGTKASAAVLVASTGGLDAATVKGIAHLVGSSVESLDPKDITITDEQGNLLWPTGDGTLSASSKLAAEQQYAAQLSAQVNALLATALGPNMAEARIHAQLNVDQATEDKVTYAKKGTPITTDTATEKLQSEGTSSQAPSGTATNIPGYAASAAGGGTSKYDSKKQTTQYGVDKTVTRRVLAPGTVERLDVALLFNKGEEGKAGSGVSPEQMIDLENAVKAAVGFDAARGDSVESALVAFAPTAKETKPATGPTALLANPIGLLKWVVLGLGTIVFLFLMRRGLRKRESEQIAPEPTWLRQIEGAVPIAQLGAGGIDRPVDPALQQRELARQEIEEIVKKEPERVAAQVGQWIRE